MLPRPQVHGGEVHVSISVKLVCCVAVSALGFALILAVRGLMGDADPRTKLRLARDEYLQRKASVEMWQVEEETRKSL